MLTLLNKNFKDPVSQVFRLLRLSRFIVEKENIFSYKRFKFTFFIEALVHANWIQIENIKLKFFGKLYYTELSQICLHLTSNNTINFMAKKVWVRTRFSIYQPYMSIYVMVSGGKFQRERRVNVGLVLLWNT